VEKVVQAVQSCFFRIGTLGNPREVVLKATEALRRIEFTHPEDVDEEDLEGIEEDDGYARPGEVGRPMNASGQLLTRNDRRKIAESQFVILIELLKQLHPRINTKYPSRFLSETLTAILATYTDAVKGLSTSQIEVITEEVVGMVQTVLPESTRSRPTLPPRKSSVEIPQMSGLSLQRTTSRDKTETIPEDSAASHKETPKVDEKSTDDKSIQIRLLQSFVTHILEEYMLSLDSQTSNDDIPGLAWAARVEEKNHPDRNIPGRMTVSKLFAEDETLQRRESMVGRMMVSYSNYC
jgi:Uncharacterised protein family, YAP/Alf4/glomulin